MCYLFQEIYQRLRMQEERSHNRKIIKHILLFTSDVINLKFVRQISLDINSHSDEMFFQQSHIYSFLFVEPPLLGGRNELITLTKKKSEIP